jgi:hypothetical protein
MCAGKDHLLRVGPLIIVRRYTYWPRERSEPASARLFVLAAREGGPPAIVAGHSKRPALKFPG